MNGRRLIAALAALAACFALAYAGGTATRDRPRAALASVVATPSAAAAPVDLPLATLGSAERLPVRLTTPHRRVTTTKRSRRRVTPARKRRVVRAATPVQVTNPAPAPTDTGVTTTPQDTSGVAAGQATAPAVVTAPRIVAAPVRTAPKPAAPKPAARKPAPTTTFFDLP